VIEMIGHEGLVAIYPRRGTFATEINIADDQWISEIRAELESLAAERPTLAYGGTKVPMRGYLSGGFLEDLRVAGWRRRQGGNRCFPYIDQLPYWEPKKGLIFHTETNVGLRYNTGTPMRGFPFMLIGYMRVSTSDDRQSVDLQRDALIAAGVDERHLHQDKASGAKDDRPGLKGCLDYLRGGDCLVVWKLDRLGRSLPHLLSIITDLKGRGVAFRSLTEQMTRRPHMANCSFLFSARLPSTSVL